MTNEESLRITFDSQLYLMSADEIRTFADSLPQSNGAAIREFCDWFSLDKFYVAALELHNPNIKQWLREAADEAQLEEIMNAEDERFLERSIRSAQGWNV
ncbi:MAG TPA: hypothetical protein VLG09_02390 [Candidatus Saccharimonadales bacterium]|nr:hypothetical protein [Candidatus Saccharimonadales bacterium]